MRIQIHRRHALRQALALSLTTLAPWGRAQSSSFPSRPLRLLAGGPGSVVDIRARWLAERLGSALGQPVVVENNAAAGGNLIAGQVARATPDGHMLLMTHQGLAAINPHLYASLGYDALRDFAWVARFGIGPLFLVGPAASPVQTVADLLARAKARPGALNFGTPGNGTPPHMAAVLFMRLAGFEATHIPYKGGGAMMTALLAGEVDWALEGLTAALQQLRAGRLRALAASGAQRAPSLPEVPTLAESGVAGYNYIAWTGLAAPAATPAAVVERLNREINLIITSEEGRRWVQGTGTEAGEQSPAEFKAFVQAEHARMGELARAAGLRAE